MLVNGSDNRTNFQIKESVSWAKPVVEDSLFSTTTIVSGTGGILLLVILTISLRNKSKSDDFDEYEEEEIHEPVSGPPATAFAGPPVTTQVEDNLVTEYQAQLDEYNRKMAEYEAWQAAQGSQVVEGSTGHE